MQHKSWHRSLGFLRVAASSNLRDKQGQLQRIGLDSATGKSYIITW